MGTHRLQLPPPAISFLCMESEISSSEVLSATTAGDAYFDDADFYRELGERVAAACSRRYGSRVLGGCSRSETFPLRFSCLNGVYLEARQLALGPRHFS